jgi:urease beta subunit
MAGNFNLEQNNSYASGLEAKIAGNSVVIDTGEAVTLSGGFLIKTVAGGTIEGTSATVETYASDNQTVAQKKLVYRPVREGDHYLMRTVGTALVFDAALVASNTINLKVNGVAMTQITYASSNDATLEAIATQLETQFPTLIASADRSGTRSVVITVQP